MLRVVISDSSPIRYLVLIGVADVLPAPSSLAHLGPGERDALLLAMQLQADLVLMDDREGADRARLLGLTVPGTLGVLDRAAERGLIELATAIANIRQTNFRIDPGLLDRLLAADARRKAT